MMEQLLEEIRNCKVCENFLQAGVNPVISSGSKSKIVIIGQAPGRKVHQTSIPWNDKSGENLRSWMNISREVFYNPDLITLMPMSFCYPGTGKSGDLPPRKECAPLWHAKILEMIAEAQLILLIGQYAQQYYLADEAMGSLTETVRNYKSYLPEYFPLPHPSPRNNIWLAKNQWFCYEVLPELKKRVTSILS